MATFHGHIPIIIFLRASRRIATMASVFRPIRLGLAETGIEPGFLMSRLLQGQRTSRALPGPEAGDTFPQGSGGGRTFTERQLRCSYIIARDRCDRGPLAPL